MQIGVMPKETIDKIEATADALKPIAPGLLHQYLFSGHDIDWFDDKGNYEEQQKRLENRRQIALMEVLKNNGVSGVTKFARDVLSHIKREGHLGISRMIQQKPKILPEFLQSEDEAIQHLFADLL